MWFYRPVIINLMKPRAACAYFLYIYDVLSYPYPIPLQSKRKGRKKDILTSFKRPKWPIKPNKRLQLKCCLVFENNKSK